MTPRAFAILSAAALIVGCDALGAPTAPVDPTNSPPVALARSPSQSGPNVVRFEDVFFAHLFDPETGLGVVYGLDPVELCQGTVDLDQVSVQRVHAPQDELRFLINLHGQDVRTSVWPFVAFDCALFTTVEPLATGLAQLRVIDNDEFSFPRDKRNVNTFAYIAHGTLTLGDGRDTPFSATTRCIWDGTDPGTLKCTDRIHLARR